jgi:MYXO-CTERM domain-containing protein
MGATVERVSKVGLSVLTAMATMAGSVRPANAVEQPNGATIPLLTPSVAVCSDKNVQRCLDVGEGAVGLIDAQADALIAPEVFAPTCALVFKPIVKGGVDDLAFGWYNVKLDPIHPGQFLRPAQSELFGIQLLLADQEVGGLQVTLDLAAEAAAGRYDGGAIGFFLAGDSDLSTLTLDPTSHALTGKALTRVFYTQHALNPGGAGANPYYQVLGWESVAHDDAFYFGWEDRQASAQTDNDFDDLVFRVSGVRCQTGGTPCDTGLAGSCSAGTWRCQKSTTACVPNLQPIAEACNGLDDDCNGDTDEGASLCADGEICDRGSCVPPCGSEGRCAPDRACDERGACVELDCIGIQCQDRDVCRKGECVGACDGVVCPYRQACREGACVDPCAGVECGPGSSCVDGACTGCACATCSSSQTCSENTCVDVGCDGQTCDQGTHCTQGACVDDCAGAQCPLGQICTSGNCHTESPQLPVGNGGADGGGAAGDQASAATSGDSMVGGSDSIPSGGDDSAGPSPSAGMPVQSAGAGGAASGNGGSSSGCGCAVAPAPDTSLLASLVLAASLLLRRRGRART